MVNLCQKLLFLENMWCTVQKLIWMSKTISVHNMFSPFWNFHVCIYWTCNSINNLSSYCGLVDAKIRASDKDLKFIYSEKATKFWEIFTFLLFYVVPVKSKVNISQNFVAFSEYMNFMNESIRYMYCKKYWENHWIGSYRHRLKNNSLTDGTIRYPISETLK